MIVAQLLSVLLCQVYSFGYNNLSIINTNKPTNQVLLWGGGGELLFVPGTMAMSVLYGQHQRSTASGPCTKY